MRDMPVKILLKGNKWKFPEYYVSDIIYEQKKTTRALFIWRRCYSFSVN